jgi:CHAT domain-containing protein
LAQIKSATSQESFELADFLKGRVLKDRIDNSAIKVPVTISPETRHKLEELSLKYIDGQDVTAEIDRNEKLISNAAPELSLAKPDLTALDKIPGLDNVAIVSYFFTLDKRLLAFVWEKDKPLKTVYLPVSEEEVEIDAKNIQQKIKNLIFFKRDGKELFDKLLKPLSLSAKHLVIVADKSLWKLPFQALSPDGEKYLIEEKIVSYAPSVSILLDQLKTPKPTRRTLQTFANPSYNNRFLQFVNDEATGIAELYNSKPSLNSTVADFRRLSDKADILHFSMHAQVDNDQPLDSFLAFREIGKESGRLTVEDLLKIKLKAGSLVFLASCDTNNVLNGEGLVSLAWGMMGSGATTVISAQWEADDKLTGIFTRIFYRYYRQGISPAEALQKASMELITNKSKNMHEPYYWADFTLNGDYR